MNKFFILGRWNTESPQNMQCMTFSNVGNKIDCVPITMKNALIS